MQPTCRQRLGERVPSSRPLPRYGSVVRDARFLDDGYTKGVSGVCGGLLQVKPPACEDSGPFPLQRTQGRVVPRRFLRKRRGGPLARQGEDSVASSAAANAESPSSQPGGVLPHFNGLGFPPCRSPLALGPPSRSGSRFMALPYPRPSDTSWCIKCRRSCPPAGSHCFAQCQKEARPSPLRRVGRDQRAPRQLAALPVGGGTHLWKTGGGDDGDMSKEEAATPHERGLCWSATH